MPSVLTFDNVDIAEPDGGAVPVELSDEAGDDPTGASDMVEVVEFPDDDAALAA